MLNDLHSDGLNDGRRRTPEPRQRLLSDREVPLGPPSTTLAESVHAWLDEDDVQVSLLSDELLDRTAEIEGPFPAGRGTQVVYQEVTWEDGHTTTSEFLSHYYW